MATLTRQGLLDREQQIRAHLRAGDGVSKIAASLGISTSAVWQFCALRDWSDAIKNNNLIERAKAADARARDRAALAAKRAKAADAKARERARAKEAKAKAKAEAAKNRPPRVRTAKGRFVKESVKAGLENTGAGV